MKNDFPKKLYFLIYDDEDKDMFGGPWMAKPTNIMKKNPGKLLVTFIYDGTNYIRESK
ncbi:MAG: hypothetical protein WC979_00440 [Candidatus Pacearchaeota archaeon]|nr:hypothetical protein [Clostridia bacterium]